MILGDQLVQLFDQEVHLGGPGLHGLGIDEAGMQAELPQQGERPEDLEAVLLPLPQQAEHLLPLARQPGVVDPAVFGRQLDGQHLLLFGRQLLDDLILGAAQQHRLDAAPQPSARRPGSPSDSMGLRK